MARNSIIAIAILVALVCYPPQWYPKALRLQLDQWFGASNYQALPESKTAKSVEAEEACPVDLKSWRDAQTIAGVKIERSPACIADNPYTVAASVRGTNNVPHDVLMQSGLTPDAIEKGKDLDGDGDPDEIHIRLEVVELNGGSPEIDEPTTQYAIAPGIKPGFWVFAPKTFGMATENFESLVANNLLRLPSPSIRIEQGDTVIVTLENSHYMPHTIHFHGVDHPFRDADGEGNDGVPIASEKPVMPGGARSYNMKPRHPGSMFYHCHVQPHVHVMMGLQGLFVIEENRPNNWVQTLNIGAGLVRAPSQAIREEFDREYDIHYLDVDAELNNLVRKSNDPRLITKWMHREYNVNNVISEYHTVNGASFPYTLRESIVVARPDENIKLRIANGGTNGIALHTHGHKATITHYDGVSVNPTAQITRDVVWIATAQRVDIHLKTTNDGLHSYGPGVWLFHDHQGKGVTTNGIGPGGNVNAIVYESYLREDGWPMTFGIDYKKFFTPDYYKKHIPVWESYTPSGIFSDVDIDIVLLIRLLGLGISAGILAGLLFGRLLGGRS